MGQEVPTVSAEPDSPIPGIKQPVFRLAIVSFLTDISSEMLYPLVPLFLTSVLGAPLAAVGLIEGFAESTSSVLKMASGWLSDRLRARRGLVLLGYSLSALAKPLLAAASAWPAVLAVRFLDRAGKGIRTAPRDALVSEVTPERLRGRAFGFHRAADTLGAVMGPAVGLGLLAATNDNFRLVFILAFIPAAGGVALLARVREQRPPRAAAGERRFSLRELGTPFYVFLMVTLLFGLGNSSDAFLILRSKNLELSNVEVVSAYTNFNAVYAVLALPVGIASDRLGRRNVIGVGFLVFAVVYFGFALVGGGALVWGLFAVYGFYMALTDGVGRALVADLVPGHIRGTALGVYQGAMAGMILLSSVIAGLMWDRIDPAAPFFLGGYTAVAAFVALVVLMPQRAPVAGEP